MELAYSPETLLLLGLVAMAAGFVDAVAGGGGLITLPALLLAQIPPVPALATNKLQGSFGTFAASATMLKRKQVSLQAMGTSIVSCFIGAILGTIAVQLSPPDALRYLIPAVMVIICLYFLFAPKPGEVESKPRISLKSWRFACVPAIGFYDGYLGAGAGMFFTLGNVALRGRKLLAATASAKILNFTSNLSSLLVFIASGKVVWVVGLCMVTGQLLGGYLGASAAISGGAKFIRPVIVVVCLLMLGRFIWSA